MIERDQVLSPTVTPDHARRIQSVQERFDLFCSGLRITASAEAVALYLTWLSEEPRTTGRTLQRTVAALDAARRLAGQEAWSESADLRTFILGLLRQRPLGATTERAEPLYAEHVALLVDATMAPTPDQQRERTAITLHAATGLTATPLTRLRWRDVRLRRSFMELLVRPPPRRQYWAPRIITLSTTDGPACPVRAMRLLRTLSHVAGAPVFADGGKGWDRNRIAKALNALHACGGDAELALKQFRPSPQQIRDKALLVLGYGAALRAKEAIALKQQDVAVHPHGLLITVAGRRAITAIPSNPGKPTDPVQAWLDWEDLVARQRECTPDRPAFPAISGDKVWERPMGGRRRLNEIVQRACELGELPGHYVFTSLRAGLIRTALRANDQAHDIAAHTDLRTLGAVTLHRDREHLLSRSVAAQLGL